MRQWSRSTLVSTLTLLLLGTISLAAPAGQKKEPAEIEFTNVQKQTLEFIEYYETIELTQEQEQIKRAALSELPAVCCADNSAYTCCCVCNLSRTVWGLTAYLITERHYGVEQIQAAVKKWTKFVNPKGFSGDACYRGGCVRSFENNGCGGMNPKKLIWE
jgi:hypothetical protein